ncbi:Kunitz/Bovine pancreatic trypsin inhibitor domain protein [Necator americanus]|uniref:Kunitz/Bovine pancreatic trypsin inhibitor domain protein n=1 Tax=Necator americanus TaxID=51031 RepID=W2SZQ8_NECAM|nr:Kunitz/Bovine pancreatic trypsin inhibitor domain protein [Necator americanus]ETN75240.1 Kunitz/Bovine pancreatic trypsin inhibitor domain protein [Necator americanus]
MFIIFVDFVDIRCADILLHKFSTWGWNLMTLVHYSATELNRARFMDIDGSIPDIRPRQMMGHKWAYDRTSKSCFMFHYGGCEGNKNNFVDKKGCEQRVEKKIKRQSEIRQFEFIVEEYTFIDHSLFGRLE